MAVTDLSRTGRITYLCAGIVGGASAQGDLEERW